jgi:predicted DNA-binding protein
MISVRLPKELEDKLNLLSQQENITKSDVIKEALTKYIADRENKLTSYDLGRELFGKYGSGKGDLSITYKEKVREKINEKMSY